MAASRLVIRGGSLKRPTAILITALTSALQNKPPGWAPGVVVASRRSVAGTDEAAGDGAWGQAFQVWGSWFSGGHLRRCRWSVDRSGAQGEQQRRRLFSCPTERPAHGWVKTVGAGACSQRCFYGCCGGVSAIGGSSLGLMESASLRRQPRTIGHYTHCPEPALGAAWKVWLTVRPGHRSAPISLRSPPPPPARHRSPPPLRSPAAHSSAAAAAPAGPVPPPGPPRG